MCSSSLANASKRRNTQREWTPLLSARPTPKKDSIHGKEKLLWNWFANFCGEVPVHHIYAYIFTWVTVHESGAAYSASAGIVKTQLQTTPSTPLARKIVTLPERRAPESHLCLVMNAT